MFSNKTLAWVVLVAFLFSISCTTTKVLSSKAIEPYPDTLLHELKAGDFVMIDRKDGKHFRFHIVFINSEAIGGKNRRILISDIANIEKITSQKKQLNEGLTLGIIVGLLIFVVVFCGLTEECAPDFGSGTNRIF